MTFEEFCKHRKGSESKEAQEKFRNHSAYLGINLDDEDDWLPWWEMFYIGYTFCLEEFDIIERGKAYEPNRQSKTL